MVKLDVTLLRYLEKDDFRILTAIEMGMRNHELVPRTLIYSISGIQNGSISKILSNLCKNQLISYERGKRYDGYRLTYRGYDYLALNVLRNRGIISSIGQQIGVGKESDVYIASNDNDDDGRKFAIKFHRLGRICFRKVTDKRDYYYRRRNQNHRTASWIYMSRLAATREFAFMRLLWDRKLLPIPEPIDMNRHCIVMELIDGTILNQIYINNNNDNDDDDDDKKNIEKEQIKQLYNKIMTLLIKLTNEFGVVHGDFNEFNIMITKTATSMEPILIDFPQMISVNHSLAKEYFERDCNCIVNFFIKRFHYESDSVPVFETIESLNNNQNHDLQLLAMKLDDNNLLQQQQTNETNDEKFDGKSELLSKFLNSLPSNNDSTIDDSNIDDSNIDDSNIDDLINDEVKILQEKMSKLSHDPIENDKDDNCSIATTTTTKTQFTPDMIKSRLLKEQRKRQQKQRMKLATNLKKNVKGDQNAQRRRKRDDYQSAKEDWHAFKQSEFD